MKRLAFDIETQPNAHRLHLMPEPEVALGNLVDPVKIRAKQDAAKASQIERAALDANFGRIVCISFAGRNSVDTIQTNHLARQISEPGSEAGADQAERDLLTWAWDQMAMWDAYASFNGAGFDLPFMLRRSLLLGVRPRRIECNPYRVMDPKCEHLDVFRVLTESESGGGNGYKRNLHFYSDLILHEQPTYGTDLDKAGIGKLYDAGDFATIERVCTWDATSTLKLAEAVEPVYA